MAMTQTVAVKSENSLDGTLGVDTILGSRIPSFGSGKSCRPCNAFESMSVSDMTGEWFVAQIRYENGRILTDQFVADLRRLGVNHFYPQQGYFLVRTRERVLRPIFPGYVFCNGDLETRGLVRSTNKTVQLLNEPKQKIIAAELESVEAAVSTGQTLSPVQFVTGRQYRVCQGHPMEGLLGYLLTFDGKTRLVLTVTMLGAATSLEIDPAFVEPYDD